MLLLYIILTIYAGFQVRDQYRHWNSVPRQLRTVNAWTTWLHLLINSLSSLLLSASNYTMQCLSSPTRGEVDRAHARGDWLDIGVVSVRNLWPIDWRRTVLWWRLAPSSVPIHVLYNPAIFKTLAANEYTLVVANTDFSKSDVFAHKDSDPHYPRIPSIREVQLLFFDGNNYANETKVHNLTASDEEICPCNTNTLRSCRKPLRNRSDVTSVPRTGRPSVGYRQKSSSSLK